MRILISGYYGFNNTGDEAILAAMVQQFRKKDPGIKITVLSADPAATSRRYKTASAHRLNPLSIISAISNCDIFISGGGGLLQDTTGKFSVIYYLALLFLAKMFGKKTAVFGQGYGPIKYSFNRKLARAVLDRANLVTVRDIASKRGLKADRVQTPPVLACADPALLLDKSPFTEIIKSEEITEFERPVAGVCLRPFRDMPEDFIPRIAEALDGFADSCQADIIFIPFKAPEDTQLSVRVLSHMKNKGRVIEGEYDPQQILGLIGSLDMVIGMRLHSLIFSAAGSVPALGISYDPKVRAFCDDAGVPCLDPDFSSKSFSEMAGAVWKERARHKTELAERLKLLRYKALLNFEAFFEYFGMNSMINLFGVRIDNIDLKTGLEKIEGFISTRKPHIVFTPNPEIIMSAIKDESLRELLNSADLNLPDGIGIVAAARILGTPVRGRITGIDFMSSVLGLCREKGYRVFLLGSAEGIAEAAAGKMTGINIAGTHHGYFSDEKAPEIADMIKRAAPDILFVGLGSPRQERWVSRYCKEIGAPVNMVIGGSLDVLSGKVKRAPAALQKTGLEWLYRLAKEPKRWKRQLSLAGFAWMAVKTRNKK
jgi:polysaccharide pyruvyl transferase CsaB